MKTIITLLLSKCSLSDRLTIERTLQEIAMIKPCELKIKVWYKYWPDTLVMEMKPESTIEFEFVGFIVKKLNDLKFEICLFNFLHERLTDTNATIIECNTKTAHYYNLEPEEIIKETRKQDIRKARQVAMFLSNSLTKKSASQIGRFYESKNGKGKDHATVLHAIKVVSNEMDVNKVFRAEVEEIKRRIEA